MSTEKQKRMDAIVKLLEKKDDVFSQKEIKSHLKKNGLNCEQSTISKYLNELGIKKISGGPYRFNKEYLRKYKEDQFKTMLSNDSAEVFTNVQPLFINTGMGNSSIYASDLKILYPNVILSEFLNLKSLILLVNKEADEYEQLIDFLNPQENQG